MSTRRRQGALLVLLVAGISILWVAHSAFAQGYVSLSGLPELNKAPGDRNVSGYLNMIYTTIVSLGALFAVVKIAYAGIKYSMSDIVTSKEDAKNDIQGALIGLAILLIPYIVLATIYPGLINFNFLGGVQPVQTVTQSRVQTGTQNTSSGSASGAQLMTKVGSTFTIHDPGGPQHGQQGTVTRISKTSGGYRYMVRYTDGNETNVGCFNLTPVPPECN